MYNNTPVGLHAVKAELVCGPRGGRVLLGKEVSPVLLWSPTGRKREPVCEEVEIHGKELREKSIFMKCTTNPCSYKYSIYLYDIKETQNNANYNSDNNN